MAYNHKESQEMYLKTIYILSKTHASLRAVDICDELGYTKSSVSRGLKILKEDGFITVQDNIIQFTKKGKDRAKHIYERFVAFSKLFEHIGVDENKAKDIACKMEHIIPDDVFVLIKKKLRLEEN